MRIPSAALLGAALCSLISGCGPTRYGCKGMPEDPACMSAVQAYQATDKAKPTTSAGSTQNTVRAGSAAVPRIDDPTPIRTPSRVMRVWVAPWEDSDGDLNVSGYMFTELEPRRWMIGRSEPALSPSITPLQVKQPEKKGPEPEVRPARAPMSWGPGGTPSAVTRPGETAQ